MLKSILQFATISSASLSVSFKFVWAVTVLSRLYDLYIQPMFLENFSGLQTFPTRKVSPEHDFKQFWKRGQNLSVSLSDSWSRQPARPGWLVRVYSQVWLVWNGKFVNQKTCQHWTEKPAVSPVASDFTSATTTMFDKVWWRSSPGIPTSWQKLFQRSIPVLFSEEKGWLLLIDSSRRRCVDEHSVIDRCALSYNMQST